MAIAVGVVGSSVFGGTDAIVGDVVVVVGDVIEEGGMSVVVGVDVAIVVSGNVVVVVVVVDNRRRGVKIDACSC